MSSPPDELTNEYIYYLTINAQTCNLKILLVPKNYAERIGP